MDMGIARCSTDPIPGEGGEEVEEIDGWKEERIALRTNGRSKGQEKDMVR